MSRIKFDMNRVVEEGRPLRAPPTEVTVKACTICGDTIGPWWGIIEYDSEGTAYVMAYCRDCADDDLKHPNRNGEYDNAPAQDCDDQGTLF